MDFIVVPPKFRSDFCFAESMAPRHGYRHAAPCRVMLRGSAVHRLDVPSIRVSRGIVSYWDALNLDWNAVAGGYVEAAAPAQEFMGRAAS